VHRSASVVEQLTQLPPLPPQFVAVMAVTHVLPEQHPLGHDVESHLQEPEAQCSPDGHWPPTPHEQAPEAHVVPLAEQLTHAAPPVPQVPSALVWHCPVLEQQPLAHDEALQTHTPPRHS
jgi:hypothetical protein